MKSHPGGLGHSQHMIALSALAVPSRWLDMGAGDGETVRLLRSMGHEAMGLDLEPRSEDVTQGDYHCAPYADNYFDGIISQCSFYVSGDVPKALAAPLSQESSKALPAGR